MTSVLLFMLFVVLGVCRSVTSMDSLSKHGKGICKSIVKPKGYTCEEHSVITQDGFILSLQRIILRKGGDQGNKLPVLFQHGLLVDGTSWLVTPPNISLAYNLVDDGYQVWIANTRGCMYSRNHTSLTPDDRAFWDWSWEDLVLYDVPATLQYVRNHSGQEIHYVGHSMGTLYVFAAISKNRWRNMLRSAVLLSPVAYLGHITAIPTRVFSSIFGFEVVKWLGFSEFNPRGMGTLVALLEQICKIPGANCNIMFTPFTGQNCCINSSAAGVFLHNELQPTSVKNMIHLSQMVRSGNMQSYDYKSKEENMKHYGQSTPPLYNMTRIPEDFPLFLSYGGADTLADPTDVKLVLEDLNGHQKDKLVVRYLADYGHADFVISERTKQDLYYPIVNFFNATMNKD